MPAGGEPLSGARRSLQKLRNLLTFATSLCSLHNSNFTAAFVGGQKVHQHNYRWMRVATDCVCEENLFLALCFDPHGEDDSLPKCEVPDFLGCKLQYQPREMCTVKYIN